MEWVKTGLIALFTMSALLLGWQTKLFNDFFSAIPFFRDVAVLLRGTAGAGAAESGEVTLKEAARPLTIIITNEEGSRYGVKYDTIARNIDYDRTSSILRDALGSASVPREINEEEWRAALLLPGVYFEYYMPVRLSILVGWLDVRLSETMSDMLLRRMFIAFSEDRSRIYYQNNDNGKFFVADTAASAGKVQELDMYVANYAQFAFETGIDTAENAPYMLLLPESDYSDIRAASVGSVEDLSDIVLHAMGHGNERDMQYYGGDGELIRVGPQFNIRVDALGRVLYRRTDVYPQQSEEYMQSESEMIEIARIIVADTLGSTGSGAEVFFETLEYSEGNLCSVYFGYYISGGRIHLYDDGYAARITFHEGMVTEFELNFRHYTLSGEFTRLLPKRQALAAAGGEFVLYYSDTGTERLQPMWVLYD